MKRLALLDRIKFKVRKVLFWGRMNVEISWLLRGIKQETCDYIGPKAGVFFFKNQATIRHLLPSYYLTIK